MKKLLLFGWTLISLIFLDLITSIIGYQHGLRELHPLGFNLLAVIILCASMMFVFFAMWIAMRLPKNKLLINIVTWVLAVGCILRILTVINNVAILVKVV